MTAPLAAAQKMVAEARAAYKANQAAFAAETATMEGVYDWSLRWMRAEQFAAANDKQNAAAIRAHLVRMLDLQKKIAALYKAGVRGGQIREMSAANFYVAEAERWLAETEARMNGAGSSSRGEKAAPATTVLDLRIKITEIRGELAQTYVDLQKANRILETVNKAKPGAIPVSQTAQFKADAEKLDVRLATLTEQLQLYEYKLKLAERSPEERAALSEERRLLSSKREPNDRAATVAGTNVRYNGKDFDSWAEELRNDLSSERRTEAIRALAAFGAHGDGRRAAEVIIEAALPAWLNAGVRSVSELDIAARAAFQEIPTKDTLPLLANILKSDKADERWFAMFLLPDTPSTGRESAQLVVPMLKDPAAKIRQSAAYQLVRHEPTSSELAAALREWLASDDPEQVSFAAKAATGFRPTAGGAPKSNTHLKLLDELLPDLLRAIERPKPYGPLVEQGLGERLDIEALAHLFETIKSSKTELGPRGQEFFKTRLGAK